MEYKRNHYVPQFVLKNFCDDNDDKIKMIDLINFTVEQKKIKKAFSKNNFYDLKPKMSDDPKKLEKLFGEKIESKMGPIIKKINGSTKSFELTREELETVKKYILIQCYRNPINQSFYNGPHKGEKFSTYSIKEGESITDFWKREMLYIIENDWETIIEQTELCGVKMIANQIYSNYLSFFTTEEEFIISDINCFTERVNMDIPKDKRQEYYEMSNEIRKKYKMYDGKQSDQKNDFLTEEYIDNYIFVVVSPKLAIVCVDPVWKYKYLCPEINVNWMVKNISSPTLLNNPKNFSLPITNYINKEKMKVDSDIEKYKDKKDTYLYNKLLLSDEETINIMILCLNEARLYISYKSSEYIKKYIIAYNQLNNGIIANVRNNFNGYISLIDHLDK